MAVDGGRPGQRGGRRAARPPAQLDARDRALVTELVYGACRMQRACDWLTGRHTRGRLDPQVRAALRVGAYQLGWTRIPPHAAVSATVDVVRGPGRSVVNAVLRRVATELAAGPVAWPDPATELSYPDWIVARLARDLGPGVGPRRPRHHEPARPPMTVRAGRLRPGPGQSAGGRPGGGPAG